jgi:hypothetical protein
MSKGTSNWRRSRPRAADWQQGGETCWTACWTSTVRNGRGVNAGCSFRTDALPCQRPCLLKFSRGSFKGSIVAVSFDGAPVAAEEACLPGPGCIHEIMADQRRYGIQAFGDFGRRPDSAARFWNLSIARRRQAQQRYFEHSQPRAQRGADWRS